MGTVGDRRRLPCLHIRTTLTSKSHVCGKSTHSTSSGELAPGAAAELCKELVIVIQSLGRASYNPSLKFGWMSKYA
eukprot:CAMPEP_0178396426 /NCGR_PEP_ID=MMETSP0689_2-20121128/13722_1 /TAXON_ID=160604 /ORGANISM="Amphidinium massartii, Strain CS-259" /LENGTH=75 /DNA_ID=CAMNT_0020017099 /DNA_START=370 /DNA_END=596 /DNA_ORIENTATION=+